MIFGGMVEIVSKKTEIVRLSKKGNSSHKKTPLFNPNDKKSNYFLNLQFELRISFFEKSNHFRITLFRTHI